MASLLSTLTTNMRRWGFAAACGLAVAATFAACSDDDEDGGGGGDDPAEEATDMPLPSSIVDGVRISGFETEGSQTGGLSITYGSDGLPETVTVGYTTYDFEYEDDTRAAAATRRLVAINARTPDNSETWRATNFAFNTDGFVTSFRTKQTYTYEDEYENISSTTTFTYNAQGRVERIHSQGTVSGREDGGNYSYSDAATQYISYNGGALDETTITSDEETDTYTYSYAVDAHTNTYNVFTPELAAGLAPNGPVVYMLAAMGYVGNASAMLPTTCTIHNYSSYTGEDAESNYDETTVHEITYRFWDNNRIRSTSTSIDNSWIHTYSLKYLGE